MYPDDGDMEVRRLRLMATDPPGTRRRGRRRRQKRRSTNLGVVIAIVIAVNLLFAVAAGLGIYHLIR
jgi:hypothetical protein